MQPRQHNSYPLKTFTAIHNPHSIIYTWDKTQHLVDNSAVFRKHKKVCYKHTHTRGHLTCRIQKAWDLPNSGLINTLTCTHTLAKLGVYWYTWHKMQQLDMTLDTTSRKHKTHSISHSPLYVHSAKLLKLSLYTYCWAWNLSFTTHTSTYWE